MLQIRRIGVPDGIRLVFKDWAFLLDISLENSFWEVLLPDVESPVGYLHLGWIIDSGYEYEFRELDARSFAQRILP